VTVAAVLLVAFLSLYGTLHLGTEIADRVTTGKWHW